MSRTETEPTKNDSQYVEVLFDDEKSEKDYNQEIYDLMLDSIEVPEIGRIYEGIYVGEDESHYLFDTGFKDYVRVDKRSEEELFISSFTEGDNTEVGVVEITDDPFFIKGSVSEIYRDEAHDTLHDIEDNEYVSAYVEELTSAGYNCNILLNGVEIKAFMPQILAGVNKIREEVRDELVGQEINVCVVSYSPEKKTWIISRKAYLKQLIPQYLDELEYDKVYTGRVTGTAPFGIFVEFHGCLTGMIHKSNVHPEWKNKLNEIEPGTPIDFFVKEIIKKKKKLILTQIQAESIWDDIEKGKVFEGEVKEHKDFGTLIKLDHETMGLIHISDLSEETKNAKVGKKVKVRVKSVDRADRRILLEKVDD